MDNLVLQNDKIRVECRCGVPYEEQVYVRTDGAWTSVLLSKPYATWPTDSRYLPIYTLEGTAASGKADADRIVVELTHPEHTITREIALGKEDGVDIKVTYKAGKPEKLRSIEDVWYFTVERRDEDDEKTGPLDFVWSQRIKSFPGSFISHYSYRSPVVMMQQGPLFAGIVPGLEDADAASLKKLPLGMDLNVTMDKLPWMSVGSVVGLPLTPDMPCLAGHSQIIRGSGEEFAQIVLASGEEVSYRYSLLPSVEPCKLGYRRAVRYLWRRYGLKEISKKENLIGNMRFPGLKSLAQWRRVIWDKNAERDYFSFQKDGKTLGGLAANRQGDWYSRTDNKKDVWFASWLQELTPGYGMHLYGEDMKDPKWRKRAESMLDFILSAPRKNGMFPVICFLESDGSLLWQSDDGWAGFYGEYHALLMAWTGWLMLMWGKTIFKSRMDDILGFCRPFADFLVKNQRDDGCIPAWYNEEGRPSRKQFREFNAETGVCALFLLEIGETVKSDSYLNAGIRGVDFLTSEVRPRQRWLDMETILSCSKKSFDFYDSITAQYPQCNLSEIFAAIAYLKKYRVTRAEEDLEQARQMLDYLLLTQQVWNHPLITINTFGGFTVQNTDNEWSDVREALCAMILYEYYLETGSREYLERSAAACRAGFEVLPYENWAHCGYEGMQYDSSLLWGGGTVITAAEYLVRKAGTLVIDADANFGVGIDACVVLDVTQENGKIAVLADLSAHPAGTPLTLTVMSRERKSFELSINGKNAGLVEAGKKAVFTA